MRELTSVSEAEEALASRGVLLFKHSRSCGISAAAREQVELFLADHPDAPVFLVDVIAHRDVSQAIAKATGIRHESPQILLVRDGKVVWHASHGKVTRESLEREAAPVIA